MSKFPPVETTIGQMPDPQARLWAFIVEREAVRTRREVNAPIVLPSDPMGHGEPVMLWTEDPILQQYRFCNVRREDDRVTRWITENWRQPHQYDLDLWFAMTVARFINWPDTLQAIGYPVPWNPLRFLKTMQDRKDDHLKMYGGAYMIRADSGNPGRGTAEYQVAEMFDPFWARRETLRPQAGDTLNSYHTTLGQLFGMGSFMAAQVVADLKYVEPLVNAKDWMTFAASGPGSRRGLNRVLGRPKDSPWTEEGWRLELGRLHERLAQMLGDGFVLHAQDIQNCLCEFDKYERVRLGEGRPRALFHS